MISQAAIHPSLCPPARKAFTNSPLNCSGVQAKLVDRYGATCGEKSALIFSSEERVGKQRKDKSADRRPYFLIGMKGEAEMTREVNGRGISRGGAANSFRLLVIGAGAAGLVAARELAREGHDVVVYEQSTDIGGVWVYTSETDSDPLSIDPHRKRVHSSMYSSLRTNLPREIMGYLDYPFLSKNGRDERRFPGYEEVNLYIKDFAEQNNLLGMIQFGVEVEYVGMKAGEGNAVSGSSDVKWIVRSNKVGELNHERGAKEETFDAVVICSGHYAEPKVLDIPGVKSWPGLQMHSHNYRVPEPFKDKVVVIIGNANSGGDISKELAEVAKEVHICARTWSDALRSLLAGGPRGNIWVHPLVEEACEDGTVKFQDGESTISDVIMHCTGYLYSFPFLDTQGVVSVENGRVDPLYKHVFVPAFAPTLSFVGLPSKIIPFQLFQAQSKWISKVLSGKVELPSVSTMMSDVKQFYEELESKGLPTYRTHDMRASQFEYCNWLLAQCGEEPMEPWREAIYYTTGRNRVATPHYRDDWKDQDVLDVALISLAELSKNQLLQAR